MALVLVDYSSSDEENGEKSFEKSQDKEQEQQQLMDIDDSLPITPPHRQIKRRRSQRYNKIDSSQRQKIIDSIFNEGMTVAQTARSFGFPHSTVRSIAQAFEEEGLTATKQRGGNRFPVLKDEHVDWISQQLDENADLTVDEIYSRLHANFTFQRPVSRTAVSRAIRKQAGYMLKLLKNEHADYDNARLIQERVSWTQTFLEMGGSTMEAVYIGEAGFNLQLTHRFGRSPQGRKAIKLKPTQKGRNVSMVVAVGKEGILAVDVKLGGYNVEAFVEFIIFRLLPSLSSARIIILDNVPFYRNLEVKEAIETTGHSYICLPPSSPHLNAAEWVFSNVKGHVRRADLEDHDTLLQCIEESIIAIDAAMCRTWIREVNKNFVKANKGEELGRFYSVDL